MSLVFVGIDDTDLIDTPGTNKLAMHLADLLASEYETSWIVRHQLLIDPRVPCTNRNGCVSLALAARGKPDLKQLVARLRETVVAWSPAGSDPGLCVAQHVPDAICQWGRRVQTELVRQCDAITLARQFDVLLEPLGGTGDGAIGALAAVGLLATGNSGRVVRRGTAEAFELTGCHPVEYLLTRGVDAVCCLAEPHRAVTGTVELGKRLRPNLRGGKTILYVSAAVDTAADWQAERVVA